MSINCRISLVAITALVGGLLTYLVLLSGCGTVDYGVPSSLASAHHLPHKLIEFPLDERPNNRGDSVKARTFYPPLDGDSIEQGTYRGQVFYHPVNLSHRCRLFLNTYRQTGDELLLDRAEKSMTKLLSLCHEQGPALYAPYVFRYAVHSDSTNTMVAPWYSGMAQGEMLTVLARLHEITRDDKWLVKGREVFAALLSVKGEGVRWVARVDSDGYYWIEEYPHDTKPQMTLNGFVAAVFGVYEYYLVSGDEKAKLVYDLSLTTLKAYLPHFIAAEGGSYYDLGSRKLASRGYHSLHIRQMRELHQITGDPFFLIMAEAFVAATPPEDG